MSESVLDFSALRTFLRTEYDGSCVEDEINSITIPLLMKYSMSLEEYNEFFYDTHLRHCPTPYRFHIHEGSYIADELSARDVIGIIVKSPMLFSIMTKHDWRSLDSNTYNMDSGYMDYPRVLVLNTYEMFNHLEDEEYQFDEDHLGDWIEYLKEKSVAHLPECESCGTQEHSGLNQYCLGNEAQSVEHYCDRCYFSKTNPPTPKKIKVIKYRNKKTGKTRMVVKERDYSASDIEQMVEDQAIYEYELKRGK